MYKMWEIETYKEEAKIPLSGGNHECLWDSAQIFVYICVLIFVFIPIFEITLINT